MRDAFFVRKGPATVMLGGGDQVAQRGDTPDMDSPAVSQRNVLVDEAGRAQEVADLIEGPAEALSRIEVLEAAHRPVASFYAPVILFDHVVFVLAGAVVELCAEFVGDSLGIAGVPVSDDLLGLDLGDGSGGAEEGLGGGHIAGLTEIDIDQGAVAVDRPVEIAPFTGHLDVRLINVPAPLLARRLRRPSASRGASLASQSRTASWVNTMPRIRNISASSRRLNL